MRRRRREYTSEGPVGPLDRWPDPRHNRAQLGGRRAARAIAPTDHGARFDATSAPGRASPFSIMTTGTARGRLTRPFAHAPSGRAVLVGLAAVLLVILAGLVAISAAVGISTGPGVLPGVSVGGVDLSGLDREAAEARLAADLPAVSTGTALVVADGTQHEVPYAELGRRYEVDAMLDAALGVGRGGGPLGDGIERLLSLVQPTALPVLVHQYDDEALAAAAHRIAAVVTTYPREASVTRDGQSLTVHPSREGRRLGEADVAAAIDAALDTIDPSDVRIELPVTAAAARRRHRSRSRSSRGGAGDDPGPRAHHPRSRRRGAARPRCATRSRGGSTSAWTDQPTTRRSSTARRSETWVASLGDEIDRGAVDARLTPGAGGGIAGFVAGLDARELQRAEAVAEIERLIADRA